MQQLVMPAKRLTANSGSGSSNNTTSATSTRQSTPLETAPLNINTIMLNGMARLTPARDLTLGGRGAGAGGNKKVFAPNLNVVRNKNTNVKTSKDFTAERGARRGGRGGRGSNAAAGRGRGGSTLIQTAGVFSEGAGAVHLRKSTGSGSVYGRASEEVSITRKRAERKDEKSAQQQQHARKLLDSSDDEDSRLGSDNEIEADKTDVAFKPIILSEGLWRTNKPSVKQEAMVIPDLSTSNEDPIAVAQRLQNLYVQSSKPDTPPPQYGRYPCSINAFLDAPQSQIFLMQLPDVLPCVSDDPSDVATEDSKKDIGLSPDSSDMPASPATSNQSTAPRHSVLKQLEEGQIGKILRYRSGRVKLVLGETRFDLDMGLESGFLQELMSVTANREERSGDMINLGPIQAKLKATPDWVHLFKQQEAAARRTPSLRTTAAAAATATAMPTSNGANST
ncbi:DNA-directed RNA polymerase III subunit RPC4 [Scaptodrosophila lebanonensis]|uniref:DNA-directed RNA polymerase III subunit RPC4 n=1 Tax=Drosophila lebanonensis TaxID=7225 RepID=A0A6J2T781_DROLE|nr:DNA-directed RNA polymerase III subunit RPC4 [Scaptodrosophila lebanonensis]